ncbi:uncharacterized protein LOC124285718 [Haliotis rubra]|uniref:uncharacterized protein LOC124285718 n=1 Tax=Haliotis rubra TaxID=36100 RepID=UPI001EE51F11|nr:uncharacterized protein LOC124285718 [Haliotis rubra]
MAVPRYLPVCIAVVVLTNAVGYTSSLSCYQCADSGGKDADCRNASALLNFPDSEKEGEDEDETGEDVRKNKYHKDCAAVQQHMCMIETHMSQGIFRSYIRDCSDGKTFSFDVTKYPLLQNLSPNNETTCTYDVQPNVQICITLCNSSLCNGPQLPPKKEIVCRNTTNVYGDVEVTCGASSLRHVLMHAALDRFLTGVLGCSYLVPVLVSVFFM